MNNRRSSLGLRIVIPDTNIYHESLTVPDSHDAGEGKEDNELAFLSALSGQHGFPDTAGGISAVSAGNIGRVQDPHPSVAPSSDIVQDKGKKTLRFDTAVHKGARCTTKCRSLLDWEELVPAMSVYVAIDSMIAVLNAYLSGWLHRGINVTTMLLREEAQYRTPEMARSNACFDEGFEFLHRHLRLCLGVLGDGDHAVKWEDVRKPSYRRIGVQPFLSMRLLEKIGKEVIQTPLDDVESIIWTVIWVGTFDPDATPEEYLWRELLDHRRTQHVIDKKTSIINYFQNPAKRNTMSLWFQEILPLLRQWLELVLEAQRGIDLLLAGEQKPAPPVRMFKGPPSRGRGTGPSKTGQTKKDFRSQEKVTQKSLPKSGGVVDIDGDQLDSLIREYMKKYLKAGVDWLEKNKVYDDLEV